MNEPTKLLLLGAGGHCRACIDVVEGSDRWRVGALVDVAAKVGNKVLGYEVVGTEDELDRLLQQYSHALVTVGQIKSAENRVRMYDRLIDAGATLPLIVSHRGYVSPRAEVGAGSIVMHGAVVNAGAVVGVNAILNSQSLVEHDAVVGNHCHLSTGAIVNGGVTIGDRVFVGSGAIVFQGVHIGHDAVVGAGAVVAADVHPGARIRGGAR